MSANGSSTPDPAPDEVFQQKISKVKEAVKSFQSRDNELPISPVPKPRRFSPNPSPTSTPSHPRSPASVRVKDQGVRVTPPESPMRRRSEVLKPEAKPKPPVRKRKKKFVQSDGSPSEVGINRNSGSDFVTIELSQDNECVEQVDGGGEGGKEKEGGEKSEGGGGEGEEGGGEGAEKKEKIEKDEAGQEEGEKGGPSEVVERTRFESFVIVEEEEEAEGNAVAPSETIPEETEENGIEREPTNQIASPDEEGSSEGPPISSGSSPDMPPQIHIADHADQDSSSETLRTGLVGNVSGHSGKKKPPPLPPPPYQPRPPPVPAKQRSRLSLGEAAATSDSPQPPPMASLSPTNNLTVSSPVQDSGSSTSVTDRQTLSPSPIYEAQGTNSGPPTPLHSVDLRMLRSRPDSMQKHLSYGSSDSLELSGGTSPTVRHSTIGPSIDQRRRIKTRTMPAGRVKGTRPLSDASLNLLDGYDVVIAAGHLQDVMKSVISNDERMQEANIYEVVQACMKAMPHITSTRELPPRILNLPDDTRSKVIHELYTTEYTYVKGLEVLSEVFKDPLAAVLGEESGRIFANVDDILAFNKGFLALLHSKLSTWEPDSTLGDIFIGMFTQSHKSMYAIYCSNYDSAELLVQRMKRKKEFEQQLTLCLQSPRIMPGLTLAAYLITPVQRVPRYILLLKDIIKHTPESHPDLTNLRMALGTMGELADYIDAQVRESQTKRTFDSLKNKVHGLADLECPERSLVKEGQCYLLNIKKLYQCILFNDMLVFAHGDSRQSKVQLQLPLEAVWIEDLEDLDPQTSNQDAIEVYTPDRPYTIYTRTSAEKKLWLAKLRETIYQLLLRAGKCTRSGSMDTYERTATFVYADRRLFTGSFVAARRHGKGNMVWPDQSKYIGDWVDDERHGEGLFTFSTREVYDGKWIEDKINGYGKMTYASNDKYIGYWKDGTRHGKGKITYSNGDIFEGTFVNGQIEGEGYLRCRNGLEYKGAWKHSQRHGQGRLRTVMGNTYEGEFVKNQIQGTGRMVYRNGDIYDGSWKGGMRQGQGKLISKREGTYDGSWFNDLRHGRGKQVYPNGDVYEGSWELNVRQGKGTLVFSTGERYTGDFACDVISGEGEMVYMDGCRYNGQWQNGLYHGQGIMVYHEDSPYKSTYNGDWRHSLRHGQGELVLFDGSVYRGLWANDKPHGKGNYSVPSANYYYSGDWLEGKKEGKGTENSSVGSYDGQWKNDQKHGPGEEKTLVGTTFTGNWERNRKHNRGVRKLVTGTVEEQVWRLGTLVNDPLRQTAGQTAAELPQLSRLDYW